MTYTGLGMAKVSHLKTTPSATLKIILFLPICGSNVQLKEVVNVWIGGILSFGKAIA
jgi:hypothetical protein